MLGVRFRVQRLGSSLQGVTAYGFKAYAGLRTGTVSSVAKKSPQIPASRVGSKRNESLVPSYILGQLIFQEVCCTMSWETIANKKIKQNTWRFFGP